MADPPALPGGSYKKSMMFSVVMILIFPLFGLISDHLGINNTFLLLGAVMFIMSAVNLKLTRAASAEPVQQAE